MPHIHYERRENFGSEIKTLVYTELLNDRETPKAYCFLFTDERGIKLPIYFPKSQVEDIRETANEVDVPLWLVEAKGLEDFLRS